MKPLVFWEMEAVFIFTGIMILLVAGVIAYVAWKAIAISEKIKEEEEKEDPCETCLRWSECNGVDLDCPKK